MKTQETVSLAALSAVLATLAAAGCYSPTFREGLPCSVDRECPSGQMCAADDRCYSNAPDAGFDPNATLLSLELSSGQLSPPFDPTVVSYTVSFGIAPSALRVTPTAASGELTINVNGNATISGQPSADVELPNESRCDARTISVAPHATQPWTSLANIEDRLHVTAHACSPSRTSPRQVAEQLGVHRATLYRHVKRSP